RRVRAGRTGETRQAWGTPLRAGEKKHPACRLLQIVSLPAAPLCLPGTTVRGVNLTLQVARAVVQNARWPGGENLRGPSADRRRSQPAANAADDAGEHGPSGRRGGGRCAGPGPVTPAAV